MHLTTEPKDEDLLKVWGNGKHYRCDFCGNSFGHVGVWNGAVKNVFSCTGCAKNILPVLIADSLHPREYVSKPLVVTVFDRIRAVFNEALIVRLQQKIRDETNTG